MALTSSAGPACSLSGRYGIPDLEMTFGVGSAVQAGVGRQAVQRITVIRLRARVRVNPFIVSLRRQNGRWME